MRGVYSIVIFTLGAVGCTSAYLSSIVMVLVVRSAYRSVPSSESMSTAACACSWGLNVANTAIKKNVKILLYKMFMVLNTLMENSKTSVYEFILIDKACMFKYAAIMLCTVQFFACVLIFFSVALEWRGKFRQKNFFFWQIKFFFWRINFFFWQKKIFCWRKNGKIGIPKKCPLDKTGKM